MKRHPLLLLLLLLPLLLPAQNAAQRKAGAAASQPADPGRKVGVEFSGAQAFRPNEMQGAIADTLGEIERQGLSNALADDAAFYLANFYREHGYSEVEVDWEILGPHRLRLKVKEGMQQRLGQVRIQGNREVSRALLLDYLLGPTRERFPRQPGNPPFVEADLESGVSWAQAYYLAQGFLNAEVAPPQFRPTRGGLVDVEVQIKEGQRYTFGLITFSGEAVFPREELLAALEKARAKSQKEGQKGEQAAGRRVFPYTTQEAGRLGNQLEYYYRTKGYFNARVVATSNPAAAYQGKVAVDFYIQPGDQCRFDGITVAGRSKLSPGFLPARFRNLEGTVYNPDKVQEKVQEMTRTGLFKTFRVRQEAQEDKTVRLDINLEEAKAKEVGFLLGFSTLEGAIAGASYRDRDLFGQGRPLTATGQYSTRGLRGEFLYTDPWFLAEDLSLRLRLYALTRQWDGYSKREEGLRAELARKISISGREGAHDLEIGLFLQARQVNLINVLIQPEVDLSRFKERERAWRREQATQELIGPTTYLVNSLGLSTNFDTRDSKINPTRGWFVNSTLDSASPVLGSRLEFIRATFAGSYYHPVGKKGLLALGARAGIIDPFQERGSIPIDERFFNGGSLSVRSFLERHLGPKDKNGYPVGGDSFTVFNAEYNHPIRGELVGATFVDAGSLSRGNDFGQMRYGVGVGLRYRLPIGPLRLDYGLNPARRGEESLGAFHLSFGFAF